jgi:hypothetical protein
MQGIKNTLQAQLDKAIKIAQKANPTLPLDKQSDEVRIAVIEVARLKKMIQLL